LKLKNIGLNPGSDLEQARIQLEDDLEKEHIFIKDNRPTIRPHESMTDPFYRKRIDFDSPFDPLRHVVVVIPSGLGLSQAKKISELERKSLEELPVQAADAVELGLPKAAVPILIPSDQENDALRLESLKKMVEAVDSEKKQKLESK